MRIKIIFSYDGSKFCGLQRQKNGRSVQKEIENALFTIYHEEILIKAAGRTDAGVHANGQVAHFDVKDIDNDLLKKLNDILLPDIYIKSLNKVRDTFHARHDAKKKEYIYKINVGPFKAALNDYMLQPRFKIDIKLLKEASKAFIGEHDFRNFVAGERNDYISTVESIKFKKIFDTLEIHFIGRGFYRYMVRNMVGALLEVAKCNIYPDTIQKMIDRPTIRKQLPTAPPQGLYLNKIWY